MNKLELEDRKRIRSIFYIIAIVVMSFFPQASFADTIVDYSVGDTSSFNSALTGGTSTTQKAITINSDMTLTSNLSSAIGSSITIYGDFKNISGASSYSGINASSLTTLTINNFNAKNFSSASSGSVISNAGSSNSVAVVRSTFTSNTATGTNNGGAIYNNTGTMSVTGSTFTSNSASNGGAIYNNGGTLNITDSKFNGNSATNNGGAIYSNGGIVNINGTGSGTKLATATDSIYSNGAAINIYTGDGGYAIFNGAITGSGTANDKITIDNYTSNILFRNDATKEKFETGGNVIFNNTVSGENITLKNGMLTLGTYGISASSVLKATDTLTLNGGILNLANGKFDTINVGALNGGVDSSGNPATAIYIDADLTGPDAAYSDQISAASASGKLEIYGINILKDTAAASTINLLPNSAH